MYYMTIKLKVNSFLKPSNKNGNDYRRSGDQVTQVTQITQVTRVSRGDDTLAGTYTLVRTVVFFTEGCYHCHKEEPDPEL